MVKDMRSLIQLYGLVMMLLLHHLIQMFLPNKKKKDKIFEKLWIEDVSTIRYHLKGNLKKG